MTSLKQLLFPTYNPDNAIRLPDNSPGQGRGQSYDYSNLIVSDVNGQLHKVTTLSKTIAWDSVNPSTDNGKRQATLTAADNNQLVLRQLDPDKAAFLKPIWAKGHSLATGTGVAQRSLRAEGKQTRGYGQNTVKKYFAAFNAAQK